MSSLGVLLEGTYRPLTSGTISSSRPSNCNRQKIDDDNGIKVEDDFYTVMVSCMAYETITTM